MVRYHILTLKPPLANIEKLSDEFRPAAVRAFSYYVYICIVMGHIVKKASGGRQWQQKAFFFVINGWQTLCAISFLQSCLKEVKSFSEHDKQDLLSPPSYYFLSKVV